MGAADLTTYVAGGTDASVIGTTSSVATVTAMGGGDNAHLAKDYGAGSVGNETTQGTLNISAISGITFFYPIGWGNIAGDYSEYQSDGAGLVIRATGNGSSGGAILQLVDASTNSQIGSDDITVAIGTDYYFILERSGSTLTFTVRTGSHSGAVVGTISETVTTDTFRYQCLTQSHNNLAGSVSYTISDVTSTLEDTPPTEDDCVIMTRMRAKNLSKALDGIISLRARLFTNDATITETNVVGDFTEAAFDGYAQQPITTKANSALAYAPGVQVVGDEPTLEFDELVWTNNSGSTVTIHGFYVIDTQLAGHGDVAAACKFPTPRQIAPAGQLKIPVDWISLDAS